MLDPEWSWPSFATERIVGRDIGVICALESQGYDADPEAGNDWLDGWNPALLARSGADAAKLLVLYRPDGSDLAVRQEALVRRTVEACAEVDVPVFVEPVPVGVAPGERGDAIVRTAERFAPFGPMLLKLPYPGDDRCRDLTDACAGTPWALLSWGAAFDEFADQYRHAVAAGCQGFMVGRAVWREALDPADRATALATVIPERLRQLVAISDAATR
jgi:tagatose 1,6-diphosphate aldolase